MHRRARRCLAPLLVALAATGGATAQAPAAGERSEAAALPDAEQRADAAVSSTESAGTAADRPPTGSTGEAVAETPSPVTPEREGASATWGALEILGATVTPGTRADLHWSAGQSFAGSAVETPVVVLRGHQRGPTLCLTAAVHGDEINGVEIVRRVLAAIDPAELRGTVIGAPIVNLLGFSRGSRYLPDRRDLNRYFPGHPKGSSASRIAHVFFNGVMRHCDRLVDFHTGSFKRSNLPQLRANLQNEQVREFVERFGATAVLHKRGARGTLRGAAVAAGIPAVTFELGEPGTLQLDHVRLGVKALDTLLDKLDMVDRFRLWAEPQPVFYRSRWLRAYRGGILTSSVRLGARVTRGEVLGVVTNPLTNERSEILSPYDGRLLGRALNQFVLPGFATFHIGIETSDVAAPAPDLPPEDPGYGDDDVTDDAGADDGPAVRSVVDDLIEDIVDEEMH